MPPSTVSGSAPTPRGMPPTHLPGGGSNAPTHLPPSFAHLTAQRSLPFSVPFQRLPPFRHPRKPLAPSFINAVCTHPGACARESNPTSALETHSHTPTPSLALPSMPSPMLLTGPTLPVPHPSARSASQPSVIACRPHRCYHHWAPQSSYVPISLLPCCTYCPHDSSFHVCLHVRTAFTYIGAFVPPACLYRPV